MNQSLLPEAEIFRLKICFLLPGPSHHLRLVDSPSSFDGLGSIEGHKEVILDAEHGPLDLRDEVGKAVMGEGAEVLMDSPPRLIKIHLER